MRLRVKKRGTLDEREVPRGSQNVEASRAAFLTGDAPARASHIECHPLERITDTLATLYWEDASVDVGSIYARLVLHYEQELSR